MRLHRTMAKLHLTTGVALLGTAASGCEFDASGTGRLPDPIENNTYVCTCTCRDPQLVLTSQPGSSQDDAVELKPTPSLVIVAGEVLGLGSAQLTGIRFPGLQIPKESVISAASIQFTAAAVSTGTPSNLVFFAEAADDAPAFSALIGDISGRTPTTVASLAVSVPPWFFVNARGPDQLFEGLDDIVQEVVLRPGWEPGNALAFMVDGSGARGAYSFDGDPSAAPVLTVEYTPPDMVFRLDTCMPESINPNLNDNPSPDLAALENDCQGRVEANVQGMSEQCGYPSNCTCEIVIEVRHYVKGCDNPCLAEPLLDDCSNFDPAAGNVTATNILGEPPVCLSTTLFANSMFGGSSTCEVQGTAMIQIGDESASPATAGIVEIEGAGCAGAGCQTAITHDLDLDDVTFSNSFGSETFADLISLGATSQTASTAGSATFSPGALDSTSKGRRGSESAAIAGTNSEDIDLFVDFDGASCTIDGGLIGVANTEQSRCEGTDMSCTEDADCASLDQSSCSDDVCNCEPVPAADMSVDMSLVGILVNRPPTADAGADQVVECNLAGAGSFTLDSTASSDPDGDLASFGWLLKGQQSPRIGFTPILTVQQALDAVVTYTARVVDTHARADEDTTVVEVVDTTAPVIACNAPATITPPDVPLSIQATASDVCDPSVVPTITEYTCFQVLSNGKIIDKTSSCVVSIEGDTLTITDSGGVADHIAWDAVVCDGSNNCSQASCSLLVVRP